MMESVRHYEDRDSLAPLVPVWGLGNGRGGKGEELGLSYLIHLLQNARHPSNIADRVVE